MKRMYFFTLLIIFVIVFVFLFNIEARNIDFLLSLDVITDKKPVSVEAVDIPSEFDDTFNEYNLMQLQSGFNLLKYRGKSVKKYTYKVLNFPESDKTVYANILRTSYLIIGGDIVCPELDGFILPITYLRDYITK